MIDPTSGLIRCADYPTCKSLFTNYKEALDHSLVHIRDCLVTDDTDTTYDDLLHDLQEMYAEIAPEVAAETETLTGKQRRRRNKNARKKEKKREERARQASEQSVANAQDEEEVVTETEEESSTDVLLDEAILLKLKSMNQMLENVLSNQREIPKKVLDAVELLVSSEGSTIEDTIIKNFEKFVKDRSEADSACLQERLEYKEKLNLERHKQQMTSISVSRDEIVHAFEQNLKNELNAVLLGVEEIIQKDVVPKAVTKALQGFIGDELVNQLTDSVYSELEATVSTATISQFETSLRPALQEALRSSLEASVVPLFQKSCSLLSQKVGASFNEEILVTQKIESTIQSSLTSALKDSATAASSICQALTELADGQKKLIDLAFASVSSSTGGSNEKVDPIDEIFLLADGELYEEAFVVALERRDSSLLSLCYKVDLKSVLERGLLSQQVLLKLLQRLASSDISRNDTEMKLSWMMNVVRAISPSYEMTTIFYGVCWMLDDQISKATHSAEVLSTVEAIKNVMGTLLKCV